MATLAPDLVADARALGWLAEGTGPGRWRLTRAGRTAVKRALSLGGTSDGDDASTTADHEPHSPPAAAPGTAPQAPRTKAPADPRPHVDPCESPIAWLRRRRDKDGRPMLSAEQFDAGERLRADFWYAQMTPKVTMSWSATAGTSGASRGPAGAGVDMLDAVVAARGRVHRAFDAVGPELVGILIDVVCHLKGLEDAERGAGWPQRSGKVILQLALTRLARHYGLLATGGGTGRSSEDRAPRIRHWGSSDFRPHIDGNEAT